VKVRGVVWCGVVERKRKKKRKKKRRSERKTKERDESDEG
jgi:hypothetical protein